MKKCILFLGSIILLGGCQQISIDELSLKEKCSKFIEKANVRFEGLGSYYNGTFYSKSLNTCVSLYNSNGIASYYDEYNGKQNFDTNSNPDNFLGLLNLIK